MKNLQNEFIFAPLGGLGEIGMNAALYGFGPTGKRKWLMIDCGLAFAGPEVPGIDLYLPNIEFVERVRRDLVGMVITHAHEDHIGAIADLWPRLKCPIFASPFAAGLLRVKRLAEPNAPEVKIHEFAIGSTFELEPFSIEAISVAHSIPESCALAIGTSLGTVIHSGDWKIDPTPLVGQATDIARFTALGKEGVLALICDSTNILRDGISPSEKEVGQTLEELIGAAEGRVLATTFASNIARIRAVAEAAHRAGRVVLIAGRALERAIAVARECGYLDGIAPFSPVSEFRNLERQKIVIIATGSQGEPRAALAKIAADEHPEIKLAPGDSVIFSSRTIPGNEKVVNQVINGLIDQKVRVITDRTALVHVSGHPRRGEVAQMYQWVKPSIAIPAHGEALHLAEHARFAREQGVPTVIEARDGDFVLLAPGTPTIIDQIATGKLRKDGDIVLSADDEAVQQRLKLSFAGIVTAALAIDANGNMVGDPDVVLFGLPKQAANGAAMDQIVDDALFSTFDQLSGGKRRDSEVLVRALERAIRAAVRNVWGKKPKVQILIVEV